MSSEDHPGEEELLGYGVAERNPHDSGPSEETHVDRWKAEQLTRLGLPRRAAPLFAHLVDWHELDALIRRGCPLGLALEIAR